MKPITLFFLAFILSFLIFPLQIQADNWDLFPFNQETYYYFQTNDEQSIAPYYMDFEEISEGSILQYPLRTYIESVGYCYPPPKPMTDKRNLSEYYSKSLENAQQEQAYVRQEFGFVLIGNPSNLETSWEVVQRDSLLFYPHSEVGDAWEIHSHTFHEETEAIPFSHLVVTCVSAAFEEILGNIEDSTKTFRIQAFEGTDMVNSDFDEVTVKLSKHYGLLQWTPFAEWLYYDLKTHISIAGFENVDGVFVGERMPLVADFFPYAVGDILKWKHEQNGEIQIFEDHITHVERNDSMICYTFNRENSDVDLTTTYLYFPQHFIDLAYWEVGIDATHIDNEEENFDLPYRRLDLQRVENEDCGIDYQLNIESNTCMVFHSPDLRCELICLTADCYICHDKYYSTQLGVTSITTNASLNFSYLNLVEAQIGDCYFTDIKEESYFASQITIYPNPTNNRFLLQINNPTQTLQNLQLKISDIHGRMLYQTPLSQSSIRG